MSNLYLEERHWLEGSELSLCYNIISSVKLYRYKAREKRFEPTGSIYLSKLNVLKLASVGADQLRQPTHMASNLPILSTTGTTCSLLWGRPPTKPYLKMIRELASRPGPVCQGLLKQCGQMSCKTQNHLICCYRDNHSVYLGEGSSEGNAKVLQSMYDCNRLL